jgi:hypothetical protein
VRIPGTLKVDDLAVRTSSWVVAQLGFDALDLGSHLSAVVAQLVVHTFIVPCRGFELPSLIRSVVGRIQQSDVCGRLSGSLHRRSQRMTRKPIPLRARAEAAPAWHKRDLRRSVAGSACGTGELPSSPVTTVPFTAASHTFGISPEMMSDGFVYQNLRFLGMLEAWQ